MMGDKIQAKKIAKEYGLPVIEGSDGGVKDKFQAKEICKKIGFPVLIKASGGGGGKGMKVVFEEKNFEELFLKQTAQNNVYGDMLKMEPDYQTYSFLNMFMVFENEWIYISSDTI